MKTPIGKAAIYLALFSVWWLLFIAVSRVPSYQLGLNRNVSTVVEHVLIKVPGGSLVETSTTTSTEKTRPLLPE